MSASRVDRAIKTEIISIGVNSIATCKHDVILNYSEVYFKANKLYLHCFLKFT